MLAARPAACSATSDRTLAVPVLEYASAWIFCDAQQADRRDHQRHEHLDQSEAARRRRGAADGAGAAVHVQVAPLVVVPASSDVIAPLRPMDRQRVQALVSVESCSVIKVPLAMPTA